MTAPHPRRYSEGMSSSIEKGHGWLLVAVCTSLFFMPFMMAGVNAVLPPLAAIALIAISMLLTVVAGLIPSRVAANKDPVVALRTE